jgi:hypothetical protein
MVKVYFILDITNNEPKISSKNLTKQRLSNGETNLLMLRDSDYCGKAKTDEIINGYVVSIECSSNLDYLEKGMKLIELFTNYNEEVFDYGTYQKIIKFNYQLGFKDKIQILDPDIKMSLSVSEIDDKGEKYLYYSNPEFHFRNNLI